MVDTSDLERDLPQLVVREAVGLALHSPLREPILEAVDSAEAIDRDRGNAAGSGSSESGDGGAIATGAGGEAVTEATEAVEELAESTDSGRLRKAIQGAIGFAVMFAVLYTVLRKLGGED